MPSDPVLPDEPSLALDSPDFAERIAARAQARLAQQRVADGPEHETGTPSSGSLQPGVARFGPSAAETANNVGAPESPSPKPAPADVAVPRVGAASAGLETFPVVPASPEAPVPAAEVEPTAPATVQTAPTPVRPTEPSVPEESAATMTPRGVAPDRQPSRLETQTSAQEIAQPVVSPPHVQRAQAPQPQAPQSQAPQPQAPQSQVAQPQQNRTTGMVRSASEGPTNAPDGASVPASAQVAGSAAGGATAASSGLVSDDLDAGDAVGEPARTRDESDYDVINPKLRSLIEWAVVVAGALAVALVIKSFLLQAYFIPSPSMEQTLVEDDRVLVNKLSKSANRGDVMVFKREVINPTDPEDLIKRVIGLEGETVEARDGSVFIDGKMLQEPYVPDGISTFGPVWTEGCTNEQGDGNSCTIPDGGLFMMGDNRQNSRDSRFFGPIVRDQLVGRAFIKVWPLGDIEAL